MTRLFVLVGMPGAGKSEFATGAPHRRVVVSIDGVRQFLGVDHDDMSQNGRVFGEFYEQIIRWLRAGFDVMADSTALSRSTRQQLITIAVQNGADPYAIFWDDPSLARERNQQRDRVVDAETMDRMEARLKETRRTILREGFVAVYPATGFDPVSLQPI